MAGKKAIPRIHEVEPREQVGAQTGKLYDFQYHVAAEHTLDVLADSGPNCVLCEWHDDFVLERLGDTCSLYGFRQVKTRNLSEGPWKLRQVFGLGRKSTTKKVEPAAADSIAARLFEHEVSFGLACEKVVLLTNSGADQDLLEFLDAVHTAASPQKLPPEAAETFEELASAYKQAFKATKSQCFAFTKKFTIVCGCGSPEELRAMRLRIAPRLLDLSEIDLKTTEAQRIGKELVELVRQKSHVTVALPVSGDELRKRKGIVAKDVLPLLSLSHDGFVELRKGATTDTLRSLSRLHRLCKTNGVPPELIPDICRFKAQWDAWFFRKRADLPPLEFTALKSRCLDILAAHSQGKFDWEQVKKATTELASEFGKKLEVGLELTPELVIGFFFALAASADSRETTP